jgi:cyanophycinase
VVSQSPSLIGLGLDEDTAAIVYADETFEVIGRGAVTVVDGSHVVTDAFQTKGHRPMMVSGAILHSLPSGYRFDLRARALIAMAEEPRRRRRSETALARLRRLSRETALEGADSFDPERRRRREEREASE